MRALLDVNVLIALLEVDHASHPRATTWLRTNVRDGWASCPITQNGCVRIMSHTNYPNPVSVHAAIERLAEATRHRIHEFWPDDISLLDSALLDSARIHGPRQITDLYLLALAVHHEGRFVTFVTGVTLSAVRGAQKRHLLSL